MSFGTTAFASSSPSPHASWGDVIRAVDGILPFFTVIVLSIEAAFGTAILTRCVDGTDKTLCIWAMIVIFVVLIGSVVCVALVEPDALVRVARGGAVKVPEVPKAEIDEVVRDNRNVLGAESPPPAADVWDRSLRPVLHQVQHYSMPTYYLDVNLNVIDWNIAFGLIFTRILPRIAGQHVNRFIAELQNRDAVFDHARAFTERVNNGELPLVDTEPLLYRSERYGRVSLLKVACQLHDPAATLRGWAVGLMITDIDWKAFEKDLFEKLRQDKLWSVYAVSYDRVLRGYQPYRDLIRDITSVVPRAASKVADLGAGTGNVTEALIRAGHSVTAVEENDAMLERLRSKRLPADAVTVVKGSIENLRLLEPESVDAVVMMNVLYAVDDVLGCLREVHRILRPNGVIALSTTHADTRLDPLLDDIKQTLTQTGRFDELSDDYERVRSANKDIEVRLACRRTREEYCEFVKAAGFRITKRVDSTYLGAVMLLHASKSD